MVKIKLRRVGAKKKPGYRLVVADSRTSRNGAFIEIIGHYNPLTNPETMVIDGEKVQIWLGRGAQPTESAAKLLLKAGITKEPKPAKVATAKKAKPAKAAVAEKPEPAKAAVTEEPEPTKASATKKPKTTKASAAKKSKTTKEKT